MGCLSGRAWGVAWESVLQPEEKKGFPERGFLLEKELESASEPEAQGTIKIKGWYSVQGSERQNFPDKWGQQ